MYIRKCGLEKKSRAISQKKKIGEQGKNIVSKLPALLPPMTSREAQETYLKNQQNVIQRIKKDVDGTTVDLTRGYTSWERDGKWHINWALGEGDVYHVTSEDYNPKKHYFFTWRAGVIEDAVAPKDMKGRKGTSNKFSALPSAVQSFIRNNISELVGR